MRVEEDNCIKCNICQDNCKHNGITLVKQNGKLFHVFNDNCKACGSCISACPAETIYED